MLGRLFARSLMTSLVSTKGYEFGRMYKLAGLICKRGTFIAKKPSLSISCAKLAAAAEFMPNDAVYKFSKLMLSIRINVPVLSK